MEPWVHVASDRHVPSWQVTKVKWSVPMDPPMMHKYPNNNSMISTHKTACTYMYICGWTCMYVCTCMWIETCRPCVHHISALHQENCLCLHVLDVAGRECMHIYVCRDTLSMCHHTSALDICQCCNSTRKRYSDHMSTLNIVRQSFKVDQEELESWGRQGHQQR